MKPIFSRSVLKSVRISAQEHSKSSSEKLQKTNRCDDKRAEKSSRRVVGEESSRGESMGIVCTAAHNIEKQAYVLKYDTNKCPASSHKIHVPLIP